MCVLQRTHIHQQSMMTDKLKGLCGFYFLSSRFKSFQP
ncbi:Unknown protein sequence [Pseudomonas syringae pv. maculicola str. M6]|nr:Unknown protein sequence [Pseudomonas syringae pv. maculicola str. M6]